ncbi:hypothetical protein SORBI_3010G159200 [Sorghum bicolor]|uniref:Uncharacterized protein n=1 Tax=Sorghum bicolor TaxID=4558 RepID=A0A1W0VTA3_SORBI|nr:hypothetical protein SORBI_3010G159200 [Sorghum bicolor]
MGSCCPARCLHVSLSLQHWFQIIAQTLLIKDTSSTRLRGWIREEPAARYDELPATLTVLAAEDIADSIDALYHKDEAMAELKSEVMEALDDDSWMFAASRSRINLVSSPVFLFLMNELCIFLTCNTYGKLSELGQASKKTRNF